MNKKLIVGIIIILIIFIGTGVHYLNNNENTITVGTTDITLPSGFAEGNLNKQGDKNITNGTNSIFLVEYNDSNITEHIDNYKRYIKSINYSIDITNYTFENAVIYKGEIINDTHTVRYWIIKDNKTYSIYTWNGNKQTEKIVLNLINSMKPHNGF